MRGFLSQGLRLSIFTVTVFQVNGFPGFKSFVQAVENGTNAYSGVNGLSDKTEIAYNYDINDGDTPAYYTNLITTTLTNLGFSL